MMIKQWHIYVVDLEPRVGTKPGKQRPCLCIQPSELCEAGLQSAVVLPLTTKLFGSEAFPLRLPVPAGTCGLKQASEVLVDQMLAWDVSLFREDLGEVPEALQEMCKTALREFLDL